MTAFIPVPQTVQRTIPRGLHFSRDTEAWGKPVAERLLTGEVDPHVIASAHRWFTVHEKEYLRDTRGLKTEEDSDVVRSWLLHGGDAGREWSKREYAKLVSEGIFPEDPIEELLSLEPREVYERFNNGAWREEYGFNPATAARFVEAYMLGGKMLDLTRAFGKAEPAVHSALVRRQSPVDHAHRLHQLRGVRDPIYQAAVEVDLSTDVDNLLIEKFPANLYSTSPVQNFIKAAWPTIIAYLILAVEDKQALIPVNHGKQQPAVGILKLKPFTSYTDASNFIHALFHPLGKRYVDPATVDKKFGGLDGMMLNYAYRAFKGLPLQKQQVIKTLTTARMFFLKKNYGPTVFQTLLMDWRKGNYDGILAMLPQASDLHDAFSTFVDSKPPMGGVELQQSPVGQDVDSVIQKYLDTQFEEGTYVSVSLEQTKAGQAAKAKGTPIGVNSVVKDVEIGTEWTIKGAWASPSKGTRIVYTLPSGEPSSQYDTVAAQKISNGLWQVIQAHADLPGTSYAKPEPEFDVTSHPADASDLMNGINQWLDTKFPSREITNLGDTLSGAACKKAAGQTLFPYAKLTGESGVTLTLLQAIKANGVKHIVFRLDNGEFESLTDGELAQSFTDGDVWIKGMKPAVSTASSPAAFESPEEYFTSAFADTIKQWVPFDLMHTDSEETFLNKYNYDLPYVVLKDKNGNLFRIEKSFYNKYTGTTLIVYRTPDGKFNEIPDPALSKAIGQAKLVPMPKSSGVYAHFPPVPAEPVEPEPEFDVTSQSHEAPAANMSGTKAALDFIKLRGWTPAIKSDSADFKWDLGDVIQYGNQTSFVRVVIGYAKGELGATIPGESVYYYIFLSGDPHVAYSTNAFAKMTATGNTYGPKQSADQDIVAALLPKPAAPPMPKTATPEPQNAPTQTASPSEPSLTWISDSEWNQWSTEAKAFVGKSPYLLPLSLDNTLSYAAAADKGVPLKIETPFTTQDGTAVSIQGAVKTTVGYKYILMQAGNGPIDGPLDTTFAKDIESGKYTFGASALSGVKTVSPIASPNTLKFAVGDIITNDAAPQKYVVLATFPEDGMGTYLVAVLEVKGIQQDSSLYIPSINSKSYLEDTFKAKKVGTFVGFMSAVANLYFGEELQYGGLSLGVSAGSIIQWGGDSYLFAGAAKNKAGEILPVLAKPAAKVYLDKTYSYYQFTTAPADLFLKKVDTGYAPMTPVPEAGSVDMESVPNPEAAKFPSLNYGLSKLAIELAKKHDIIYVPSGKAPPFLVGTLLAEKGTGKKLRLIGWTKGMVIANQLVGVLSNQDGSEWFQASATSIGLNWDIQYTHTNLMDESTGEVVFGKTATAKPINITSSFATIPSQLDDYPNPSPIQQPAMKLPKTGHVSAGVFAVFPPNNTKIGNDDDSFQATQPLVVMTHPMNDFGGYSLTFPKGTVEPGESIEKAAVREAWEETGLAVKIVGFLSDYEGTNSVTRMFMGYVIGGDPKKAGQETDAVTLKPVGEGYSKTTWFKGLHKRDQIIISDGVAWIAKNKAYPHQILPSTAENYSQVTAPPKFPKSGMSAKAAPADTSADAFWNAMVQKSSVPVTKKMLKEIKNAWSVDALGAAIPKQAIVSDIVPSMEQAGWPEYGEIYTGINIASGTHCSGYVTFVSQSGSTYRWIIEHNAGDVSSEKIDISKPSPYTVDIVATSGAKSPVAFFPSSNPYVASIAVNLFMGSPLLGLGLCKQYLKDTKVPFYEGLTAELVPAAMGLLVPNAITGVQRDAILQALQHNLEIQGQGGQMGFDVTSNSPNIQNVPKGIVVGVDLSKEATPLPVLKIIIPDSQYYSQQWKAQLAAPDPKQFKDTGKSAPKGSNPTWILEGPGGLEWFAKGAKDSDPVRAFAEAAAYKLVSGIVFDTIPVGTLEYSGATVSIQPMIKNLDAQSASKADPNQETDENKAILLRDHAIDMFLTDHDGNSANYIKKSGKVIRIDRGQAFKFYLHGDGPVLKPDYEAPGNHGTGYAKKLLIDWGKHKADIPEPAFYAMRQAIADIQELSDDVIDEALKDYFAAGGITAAVRKQTLKKIYAARDAYLANWTIVLKNLRSSFKWPSIPENKNVFSVKPKEQGITAKHAQIIQEAVDAGWQGKSLQIDGPGLENQEVMVRQVLWEIKSGKRVPATLIHFRMARPAGLAASKNLLLKGEVSEDGFDAKSGPHKLKAEIAGGYWTKILAATITVNHHWHEKKGSEKGIDPATGKPIVNQVTLQAAYDLEPSLHEIKQLTQDPSGTYSLTGESNEAVNAMATQYIQYIKILKNFVASANVGDKTPIFSPFLWEDPPLPKKMKSGDSLPVQVIIKQQGAVLPQYPDTLNLLTEGIVVSSLNNPVYKASTQAQFHLIDDNANAHVFLNPPGGVTGLLPGVEGHKGIGWGIIPGAPTPQTVAHLLKMFEDYSGQDMKPSTSEDSEAMYWSKQASNFQPGLKYNSDTQKTEMIPGYSLQPKPDDTIAIDPPYIAALDKYRSGKTQEAIDDFKTYVADKLGVPVNKLDKLPGYAVDGEYTRGAGWKRITRLNWTRPKLESFFGKTVHVGHRVTTSIDGFFGLVVANGALLAGNVKPFYGIQVADAEGNAKSGKEAGASVGDDIARGGSQGIFTCLRRDYYPDVLYFDISLLLRTDWYMVGTGDTYGNTSNPRYTTPEALKAVPGAVGEGIVTTTSYYQISFRHDIDLQQYLYMMPCSSVTKVNAIRGICQKAGWLKFSQGRSLEEVVVNFASLTPGKNDEY